MSSRLPARATRGNRMNTLVADEEKGEDEFWSQHKDMFADEAGDEEFSDAPEEEDVVDADFDVPEDQPAPEEDAKEAEAEAKQAERPVKKKSNVYVDPKRQAKQHPKRVRREKTHFTGEEAEPRERAPRATAETSGDAVATHLRASTKQLTKQKHAERQREQEEYEIRRASRPRRSGGGEGPRMSQEQMLAEAKRTEEANRASLEILLRIEEERKRVGPIVPAITGPMVRYKSTKAATTITFADHEIPSPPFDQSAPVAPAPRVCPITGLTARYYDPKTNQPYATTAAFKALRDKAAAVKVQALSALLEEKRRKREELARAMGTGSTPQTPLTAPSPAIPGATVAANAAAPAAPVAAPLAEDVTQ